jgi:hypothetical protein
VGGTCGTHGRGVYRVLIGRPEGKIPLGRLGVGGANIKMDLTEIGIDVANWIQLSQDGVEFWFHKEGRIFFDKLSDNQLFN